MYVRITMCKTHTYICTMTFILHTYFLIGNIHCVRLCYCYYHLDFYSKQLIEDEFSVSFSLIYITVLYEYLACAKCVASKLFTILYMDILRARCLYTYSVQKDTLLLILNVETYNL